MIDARLPDPLEQLRHAAEKNGRPAHDERKDRAFDGARFILDAPEKVPSVWGSEDAVLWSAGEPFLIVGPAGVGKTTLGERLALARAGLADELLGLPVTANPGRVLYIAADRPRQAARSFRRMVGERDRQALEERLVVWSGPLPFDLAADPAASPISWPASMSGRS